MKIQFRVRCISLSSSFLDVRDKRRCDASRKKNSRHEGSSFGSTTWSPPHRPVAGCALNRHSETGPACFRVVGQRRVALSELITGRGDNQARNPLARAHFHSYDDDSRFASGGTGARMSQSGEVRKHTSASDNNIRANIVETVVVLSAASLQRCFFSLFLFGKRNPKESRKRKRKIRVRR